MALGRGRAVTRKARAGRGGWPAIGGSIVIFALRRRGEAREPVVLLVRRATPPFVGWWALPGGWPAIGVSIVIFGLRRRGECGGLVVLLVRRATPPFVGWWALPGGWVHTGEGLEESARRHLLTKTGLDTAYLEQLYTFGRPDR